MGWLQELVKLFLNTFEDSTHLMGVSISVDVTSWARILSRSLRPHKRRCILADFKRDPSKPDSKEMSRNIPTAAYEEFKKFSIVD